MGTETLKLISPMPPNPVERCCGTCEYFRFSTGPTGRRRPSEAGTCEWVPIWPAVWADSYHVNGFHGFEPPPMPRKRPMYTSNGRKCATWRVRP